MGSPDGDSDAFDWEKPQHRVNISRPYYIGKYLVTQKQWQEVMVDNSSRFKGDNIPLESVSWEDAQYFIRKLNELAAVEAVGDRSPGDIFPRDARGLAPLLEF